MRKLIIRYSFAATVMLVALAALGPASTLALGAMFKFYWKASAQSANTVKLIRNGYLYSGSSPNVITMNWNATYSFYEAVLDDGTHVNDYWRIEDGSGTVVADSFNLSSKIVDADQVEDLFVRNDGDEVKRGNLTIRPASATTDIQLLIDNSSTVMTLQSSDTAGAGTNRQIQFIASSIDLQTQAGADIAIFGVGQNSSANSAATRSNIDSLKTGTSSGTGWSSEMNLLEHESRIDNLEGSGTFTANDTLNLSGSGGRGRLDINWNFDPVARNDSVEHYEVYYSTSALAGYSQSGAAALSSATLSQMRSNMSRMGLPDRTATSTTMLTFEDWYVIVVAFDHTSPTAQAWGSNQVYITGADSPIDNTTPLIGDATSVVDGLEQLANEVATVIASGGNASTTTSGIKVWYASNFEGTAGGTPSEIEWYQAASVTANRIYTTFYKDATFNTLRFRFQSKHSGSSKDGTFYMTTTAGAASKTVTHSSVAATWQDNEIVQDISGLSEGIYQAILSLNDGSSGTSDTLYMRRAIVESYNQ